MNDPLVVAERAELAWAPGPAAAEQLTFVIQPGQLVALLGPNGGGKSTLLRALVGELAVRSGRLERRCEPAYLAQNDRTRLDLPVSTLDVATMGLLATLPWWRPPGRDAREQALAALDQVGLADRAGSDFGKLSGGQRRRVLLARTLVSRRRLVLLDEPYAGVDPGSAQVIRRCLEQLRDDGAAVLVATHDIEQARAADRVLCLNRRQIAFGPPGEVLDDEVLLATYGADMTVLPGTGAVLVEHHHHDD